MDNFDLKELSDQDLTDRLLTLAAEDRETTVSILAHLAEFDDRKLYSPLGHPSLFAYCVKVLRFSEDAAYKRIHAARAVRRFPDILEMVGRGDLHLAAVLLLAPHLNEDNARFLLTKACGRSKRDVEFMVAAIAPQPDKPDIIRRLPGAAQGGPAFGPVPPAAAAEIAQDACEELTFAPSEAPSVDLVAASQSPAPARLPPVAALHDLIEPTAPDRVRFSFTGGAELLRKVERAQAVLWHKHPSGKLEDIFAEALDFLLAKKDPELRLDRKKRLQRKPAPANQDTESRRIPQWVKDEVWARDQGRCAFIAPDGQRCAEREGLEFDHIMPWALGGRSFDPRNIRLLCRGHNQDRARRTFGRGAAE